VLELVFLYWKTSVNRNRSFQKFGSYLSKFWRVKLRVKLDFWGLKRYTGGGEELQEPHRKTRNPPHQQRNNTKQTRDENIRPQQQT
jgi:hypothetical protein